MSRSEYKPLVPQKGNEELTNQRNFQNIYAILNRIQAQADDLQDQYNVLVIKINTLIDEVKVWSTMMMDDD